MNERLGVTARIRKSPLSGDNIPEWQPPVYRRPEFSVAPVDRFCQYCGTRGHQHQNCVNCGAPDRGHDSSLEISGNAFARAMLRARLDARRMIHAMLVTEISNPMAHGAVNPELSGIGVPRSKKP